MRKYTSYLYLSFSLVMMSFFHARQTAPKRHRSNISTKIIDDMHLLKYTKVCYFKAFIFITYVILKLN